MEPAVDVDSPKGIKERRDSEFSSVVGDLPEPKDLLYLEVCDSVSDCGLSHFGETSEEEEDDYEHRPVGKTLLFKRTESHIFALKLLRRNASKQRSPSKLKEIAQQEVPQDLQNLLARRQQSRWQPLFPRAQEAAIASASTWKTSTLENPFF
mmetsp:Transcript_82569/g.145704  ORF Transcript_82569/g.145704 Transcript_82569/m.145704 type:complete len:152 (+) Transcript_82569:37-492(+)